MIYIKVYLLFKEIENLSLRLVKSKHSNEQNEMTDQISILNIYLLKTRDHQM